MGDRRFRQGQWEDLYQFDPPVEPDDDDDRDRGSGGDGNVGPSGDPPGFDWWNELPIQTLVDLRGEEPMIGAWGGENYNVLMPDNPIVDEANQLSATEQMQLFTLMANAPSDGGQAVVQAPVIPGISNAGTTGYQAPEVKWKVGDYQAQGPNVPDWWQPMVPRSSKDHNRPDAAYSMMMNALIPSLSPEDQVAIARQLYEIWGNDFSMYKNIQPEHQISQEQQLMGLSGTVANEEYFMSAQRGNDATATLNAMREATVGGNRWKLGPGYKFLQEILNTFRDTGFSSRQATVGAYGELDPILGQTKQGELSPYGPIAQMIAQPFFSQFQLNPSTKTQSGDFMFGKPNQWLQF